MIEFPLDDQTIHAFAAKLKKGYELMQEKRYAEAKESFSPYVQIMRTTGKKQFRLFYSYCLACLYVGEIEDFFAVYEEIKAIETLTEEEQAMQQKLDQLFITVLEEMQ